MLAIPMPIEALARRLGGFELRRACRVARRVGHAGREGQGHQQADLPRSSYAIVGTASQFVEAPDGRFNPFASKVRADIERILADYEIEDKSTMRKLLGAKLDLQELDGEYKAGLQTIEAFRALEEKPSSKLTSGLFARARLQAALDAGTRAVRHTYRRFASAISSR